MTKSATRQTIALPGGEYEFRPGASPGYYELISPDNECLASMGGAAARAFAMAMRDAVDQAVAEALGQREDPST